MKNFIFFLIITFTVYTQAQTISENARFSLLTVGVGDELYSAYGHSAIRLNDPAYNTDIVFNWGIFNFGTPNFYYKFASGKLDYLMGAETYESFIVDAQYKQRSIHEQILNLNPNERKKLLDLIVVNYQPQNRSYKYDFLWDNCATRIRDLILNTIDNKYIVDNTKKAEIISYRQLNIGSLEHLPWIQSGIDLMLGMKSDENAGFYYGMYLPEYMYGSFNAIYRTDSSKLISSDEYVFTADRKKADRPWFTPFFVFTVLAIVMIVILPFFQRAAFWTDGIFYTIIGFVGIVIGFMWFVSEHKACDYNFNFFWALPFNVFYFLIIKNKKISKYYFTLVSGLAFAILLSLPFLPQKISITFVPLIVLVAARGINRTFDTDTKYKALFNKCIGKTI